MYPSLLSRFDRIFDLFRENGIIIRPKVFRGYYGEKRYPESYTEKEKNKILMYSNLSGKWEDMSLETQIDPDLDRYFIRGDLLFKGQLCAAGKDFVVITYAGDVIRCHGEPSKMGNIFSEKIELFKEARPCSSKICPCPYYGLKFAETKGRTAESIKRVDRQ